MLVNRFELLSRSVPTFRRRVVVAGVDDVLAIAK
jgi:hypothetical protein